MADNHPDWEDEISTLSNEATESTLRSLRLVEESKQTGAATLEKLHDQTDQIGRTQDMVANIHGNMYHAERLMRGMESMFGTLRNTFSKNRADDEKKAYQYDVTRAQKDAQKDKSNTLPPPAAGTTPRASTPSTGTGAPGPAAGRPAGSTSPTTAGSRPLSSNLSGGRPGSASPTTSTPRGNDADRAALGLGGPRAGTPSGGRGQGGMPAMTPVGGGLNPQVQTQVQKNIAIQDQNLDLISSALGDLKNMSLAINQELNVQSKMIDKLGEDIDKADSRIQKANFRTKKIT
eukprot:TRINITY_DN19591_c0_g1::TRINITY_DN19591_c0_g1_i1::g.24469::m.24469 TRINITY_DN19591_c0_g1::TRINITY_DN19591_c0_g1_i1::g.24469  ORF type:complete len:290 (+),score=59.51,sp/Q9LMG8/SNP30_ARATH/40.00/3e-07,SNARE/PF05739.14/1.8e+02,SNARE/PF05739.14/2.1e-11,V-SNARE_C/PF12352.3/6e-07,V-SNARE_C/PF12352.3/8.3e+02,Sec20/PF03908.8/0.039,Sec20/PF03908.8/3e+02,Herpes_capsid/PF06112.6/9.6,NPV_P10/PF05531.7/23,NPV_P10/PF05531.7/91 TRINITY_DN19591_c0_g1_i1:112-981(+)